MWSLYRKKEAKEGIFNHELEKLKPLEFTNGKTQEDVVNEILEKINQGKKIIFLKGMCGTGKSAIALNLAKHFKKTAIVVPSRSLQDQYERDYGKNKMVVLKKDKPLKISVIKGRANFFCRFSGEKADHYDLPCTIEIREKNLKKLLQYVDQNPSIKNKEYFNEIEDIRRIHVAPACPYWAMISNSKANPNFKYNTKKKYTTISGEEFAIFRNKKGCEYYDQYDAYADADVIVFNSQKYLIETELGRKPKTELDVIDECDEFLDNFAGERSINLQRLQTALNNLTPPKKEKKEKIKEMIQEIQKLKKEKTEQIQKLTNSPFKKLFDIIMENKDLAEDEETNYFNTALENLLSFQDVLQDTYITIKNLKKDTAQSRLFQDEEETIIVTLASINLSQKIKELLEKNNIMLFMSGTLHSEEVLRDVFNIKDFEIVEAETKTIGEIKKTYIGLERNCSFANFKNQNISRETYLKILDMCLANASLPVLVQISAFRDLPTKEEKKKNFLEHLPTQEEIKSQQENWQKPIEEFYSQKTDKLFTTKCTRGIDFPGEKCNSVIITRFPYPNIDSLFWKVFKKEHPDKFMKFYLDKGKRELYQRIARAVRFKGDKVELLSPDSRVLRQNFE